MTDATNRLVFVVVGLDSYNGISWEEVWERSRRGWGIRQRKTGGRFIHIALPTIYTGLLGRNGYQWYLPRQLAR